MKTETTEAKGTRNENPPGIGFWALIKEDYITHDRRLSEPGFWAVAVHRYGNWRMGIKTRLLRLPFSLLYHIMFTWVNWIWGIMLCYTVRLGRRVRIWHHGGIVLSAISIGSDVHIRQNTTLGVLRRDENAGKPVIEDYVDIGCGACILGGVTVGHHSVIGANAVVIKDIPPYSVAVGVPAKVVKTLNTAVQEQDEPVYDTR